MLWLPIAAMLLGAGLLLLGLRGRRADDHPICRKCKFDLVGLYPGVGVCPECGSPLRAEAAETSSRPRKQAIRVGNRTRRRAPIVAGTATLLISTALLIAQLAGVDWDSLKPFPVLTAELRMAVNAKNTLRADELLSEILDRVQKKRLNAARLDPLVDRALDIQADPEAAWSLGWGDLIETYDAAVGLDPERLAAYLRRGVMQFIAIRPSVRSGDFVPIQLGHRTPRLGAGRAVYVHMEIAGGSVSDRLFRRDGGSIGSFIVGGVSGSSWGSMGRHPGRPPLEPGRHKMIVDVEYTVRDGEEDDAAVVTSWIESASIMLEVLPRDDNDIELIPPEESQEPDDTLRGEFTVRRLAVRSDSQGALHFDCRVSLNGVYQPCAFDVFLVREDGDGGGDAGGDILLGVLMYEPAQDDLGDTTRGYGLLAAVPPGFNAPSADIVLRPSRKVARTTHGLTRIWGGEIVIEDVPITYPDK